MNDLLAFFAAFVGLAGELLDEWIDRKSVV